MKKTLVTHNSVFHADETMATAILSNIYGQDEVKIVRTNRSDKYIDNPDTIIYDIGMGQYEIIIRKVVMGQEIIMFLMLHAVLSGWILARTLLRLLLNR